MSVIALTSPYSLKTATLSIAADDFTAAVSQVQFDPSTSASTWRGIGGNIVRDQSIAEWSVTLGLAQDLDPAGLLRYLLDHEGEEKAAVFTPTTGGPSVTADVIISPAAIGGTAGADIATSSVTLVVVGAPAFSAAAAVPTISSALPSGAGDGDVVSVGGSRFTGTTGVTVGGSAVGDFYVVNDSQIIITVPVGDAGSAPIIVTNATGASSAFAYTRGA